jgi:Outer membrane protein beta-barrel domain
MFNNNIGVQMNVKDFFGLPIKQSFNNFNTGESSSHTESFRYSGMMLQVIPSVVLDLGLDKIDPYARFGMSIGAFPQVMLKKTEVQNGNTYEYMGKYIGNVPLGFSAAVGVKYNLNDNFSLFGEFDCNGINYSPKKYKLTKYSVNGVDALSTLPVSQTETDFVKSYDQTQNTPGSPTKQLKQIFPFSNFELNIGVTYRF